MILVLGEFSWIYLVGLVYVEERVRSCVTMVWVDRCCCGCCYLLRRWTRLWINLWVECLMEVIKNAFLKAIVLREIVVGGKLRTDEEYLGDELLLLWLMVEVGIMLPSSISFILKLVTNFIDIGRCFLLHYYWFLYLVQFHCPQGQF